MALVTNSIFLDILLALLPVLYLILRFLAKPYEYWDRRGVPNIKSGNLIKFIMGKMSQSEASVDLYNKFPENKFSGFFQLTTPVLLIRDPELIHKILVKDFVHFQDRGMPLFKNDLLSQNLFSLQGQIWRSLRYKLTPTFTTGKLRMMFEQVSKSGDNMMDKIKELVREKNNEFECKSFLFQFTLDVISSCAFGLHFAPNSPECITFKKTIGNMFTVSISTMMKYITLMACPKLAEILNLKSVPQSIEDYFLNLTKATIKYRKDNNIHRNDYLQLLMTLKEQEDNGKDLVLTPSDATEDDAIINQMRYTEQNEQPSADNLKLMTEELICANSFIFLTGGSENTASTINFTLFNLAQHPDIQRRLQHEVDTVLKRRGNWSYDAIKEMTYLDQVVQETQRLYPLIAILFRECVLPYKVPDSDLVIEKGVLINIPVLGLHKDPQYYPDPDRFNPDRFEGNNFKPNSTFLPFGDGPRICIAMRFAVMEIKTCVARIVSQYTVRLSPKTKLPLTFNKRGFVPEVEGGIWLSFDEREKN